MTPTSASASAGTHDCRGDLLGQSRRGALTDAGRLALDAHLAGCASCRLSRDVLADFDQVDVVDIRDGARVQALVAAARAVRTTGRGRARKGARLRAAAAAAALIVFGGSASAAVWWWRRPAPTAARAGASISAPVEAPGASSRAASGGRPAPVASSTPVATSDDQPAPRRRLAARARTAAGDPHVTAGALLAEASSARGEGQLERAVFLYRRLQREFPGTPEALVASVPLGRLLLDGGSARAARAAFEGYLREAPRGPLCAEALYGKGRALELLGDGDEERGTWERLVNDHAGSAYAPHARRRLAALR